MPAGDPLLGCGLSGLHDEGIPDAHAPARISAAGQSAVSAKHKTYEVASKPQVLGVVAFVVRFRFALAGLMPQIHALLLVGDWKIKCGASEAMISYRANHSKLRKMRGEGQRGLRGGFYRQPIHSYFPSSTFRELGD